MKETFSTHTKASLNDKPLSLDDLKKIASKVTVGSTGTGHKKRWFERLMNRFGWYRSSEWYLIDTSKVFNGWPNLDAHKFIDDQPHET